VRCKGAARATPVMEKAHRRASEKNLEAVINTDKSQGNDYTLLDSLSNSHLELVATDSCVVFNPRGVQRGRPYHSLGPKSLRKLRWRRRRMPAYKNRRRWLRLPGRRLLRSTTRR
jgi:hypothetical protein